MSSRLSGPQIANWCRVARANFLLLPVVLVSVGGAVAWYDGFFSWTPFLLTLSGVVFAHISVNLFNEYSDWNTGIDIHTVKTPFSGGSGTLPAGMLQPGSVHVAAWGTLGTAFIIGLWLAWHAGWPVLVMMAAGGIATVFYTNVLARYMLGELTSGITLGSLVVLGAYFVQSSTFTIPVIWISIPPGILTMLLLFLNEFPDADADRAGGRRHLVIVLGRRVASWLYVLLLTGVYLVFGAGVLAGVLPMSVLLGCLTIPLACMAAFRTIRFSENPEQLVAAQGMNVGVVLATDLLLAIGFLLA